MAFCSLQNGWCLVMVSGAPSVFAGDLGSTELRFQFSNPGLEWRSVFLDLPGREDLESAATYHTLRATILRCS